jgi:hypothetical protein
MIVDGYTAKLQEQLIQRRTMLIEEGMSEYIMNRESLKRHCEAMCKKFKDVPTSGTYGEHRLVLDLLEQTEWIPVGERLPKEDESVLLTICANSSVYGFNKNFVKVMYGSYSPCEDKRDWIVNGVRYYIDNVIAWMPLPKPYDPQESEDNDKREIINLLLFRKRYREYLEKKNEQLEKQKEQLGAEELLKVCKERRKKTAEELGYSKRYY